jgi:FixJ family two-component response regulator
MSKRGSLIAVVDDDADVLKSLGRLLRSLGYAVLGFSSGKTYLTAMDQHKPECVVLDMQMPEMSGFEVQAEIARRNPALPVIFITAHDDPTTHEAARRLGLPLLLKPFPETALIEAVLSVTERCVSML